MLLKFYRGKGRKIKDKGIEYGELVHRTGHK
jgi:hypothetical protein